MKEYTGSRSGYALYREIVNGKGHWTAIKLDPLGNEIDGTERPITYDQARGLAPLDSAETMSRYLGRILLPRKRR